MNNTENEASSCWPKDWLSNDIPTSRIRLLAVDYESRVSEWQLQSMPRNVIRRSMHDRAQEIAEQLKQAGVGKRPIIWVGSHTRDSLRLTRFSVSLGCTFNGRIVNQIHPHQRSK